MRFLIHPQPSLLSFTPWISLTKKIIPLRCESLECRDFLCLKSLDFLLRSTLSPQRAKQIGFTQKIQEQPGLRPGCILCPPQHFMPRCPGSLCRVLACALGGLPCRSTMGRGKHQGGPRIQLVRVNRSALRPCAGRQPWEAD